MTTISEQNLLFKPIRPDWRVVWGNDYTQESRGAVFTRPEIVDLILDLAGYTPDKPLHKLCLLEPGCGESAFLQAIVSRLMSAYKSAGGQLSKASTALEDAVRAIDIDADAIAKSRALIVELLGQHGLKTDQARRLADSWLVHADYLLHEWDRNFDFIIGNPPYVRIEALPRPVLETYRGLFQTASNRADLYIPFFERSLELLTADGTLGFICTNRFVRNRYGSDLRALLAASYHVRYYIDLQHTQPFLSKVSAYPAIFILDRHRGEPTRTATLDEISASTLTQVKKDATAAKLGPKAILSEFATWYPGGEAWISSSTDELRLLQRLEAEFPVLEASGDATKTSIGVATGADKVYVVPGKPDVEEDRLLPMAMAFDLSNKEITWSGHYLINPFSPKNDGSLVNLEAYPRLKAYLLSHADKLRGRHVSKRSPNNWYRTIDRIWPDLVKTPKLLIPDIQYQRGAVFAYDEGTLYPHHNVYYIASESWNLHALKTLLRSSFVLLQVQAMSVQMRGGALRFQTQTLRRLRVPHVTSISPKLLAALAAASTSDDQELIDDLARQAYDFTTSEAERLVALVRR